MGHAIQVLIFSESLMPAVRCSATSARPVRLIQGLALLPLTEDLIDELDRGQGNQTPPPGLHRLTGCVRDLALRLSSADAVAYVETDYFGGHGVQSAAAWRDGQEVLPPTTGESGAINAALRVLGVVVSDGRDEFDTLGLGRCRDNDGWLEEHDPG